MNCLTCFLGGSSPNGFRTHFGEMISDTDYRTYIIKGGPGTGKSSLMKRLAEAFPDEEKEIYFCSSDPDSLDAVIFRERKVIFVDGTAPHTFDPDYPGAVQQILDLGACWDASSLRKSKEEIISATAEYLQHHARCRRFITALAAVTSDTCNIGRLALNEQKLEGFIDRLAKKVLPKKKDSAEGKTVFRQLSALTP
ncbi:MAG: ATPase, partial [Oscillospiraceae bacterium]